MKKLLVKPFITSLTVPFIAAAIGSYFTAPAINTWYRTLEKPFFSPPNWVFGPMWTLLYLMMGIALYLVWIANKKNKHRSAGIQCYAAQLVLNAGWSILFFGLHAPFFAGLAIIALWLFIFLTIKEFRRVSKPAAWLLIPYLCWVSFAAVLNIAIIILNP